MVGSNRSRSTTTSSPMIQGDLRRLRGTIGNTFQQFLGPLSQSSLKGTNVLDSTFVNMFGENGADVFGAKEAIQRLLGGDNLGAGIQDAFSAQLPSLQRGIEEATRGVLNTLGPAGLRFSTDADRLALRAGQDMTNEALARSLQAALQNAATQSGLAGNVLGTVGSLKAPSANLLPLILQYATAFAPVGQTSQGTSSGFELGFRR